MLMKHNLLCKGLALSLAAAVFFTSPALTASADEILPDTGATLSDGSETEQDAIFNDGTYYYATVNMPYADFYYGELNDVTPITTADLNTTDPVAAYRADGQYDVVSSATTSKSTKFPTTYWETVSTGVNIIGITNVQVAIPVALYDSILANKDNASSCQNKLYEFFNNMTFSAAAFNEYKIMSGDGTFTAITTSANAGYDGQSVDSDAAATITTKSSYGNYQISISGISVSSDTMLGVVLETSDGSRYGLEHLENLWLQTQELSFAVEDFTEIHGNKLDYQRYQGIQGKTITKITYLVKGASDVVINTSLPVKYLLSDSESASIEVANVSRNVSGMTTTYTNGIAQTKGYDGTLSSLSRGKTAIDTGLYSYSSAAGTITLDGSLTPGSYTAVFTDDAFEDVSTSFLILSPLKEEDVKVDHNQLVISGTDATLSEYIGAITAISINGTSKTTTGIGAILFNSDGSINFAAVTTSRGQSTPLFASGVNADYTLTVTASGYPSITATVGKSSQLIPMTGISLTKTLTLAKGKTAQLQTTITPSDTTDSTAVTYTSLNPSVATVSADGTVTAVSCGTAVIQATVGTFSASCTVTVPHTYGSETVITPATSSKDGSMGKICTSGNEVVTTSVIPKIKAVTLSASSYSYNGKTQKPTVKVTDRTGAVISSKYYTVTYPSKSKDTGSYTVKVTFSGKYSGSQTASFTIVPAKTTAKLGSATKSSLKASWSKVSGATGYVVEYSTSSSFKKSTTVTTSSTSKTIKSLSKNKKYYVRVKSYKTVKVSGKSVNLYSSWSSVKSLSTAKK